MEKRVVVGRSWVSKMVSRVEKGGGAYVRDSQGFRRGMGVRSEGESVSVVVSQVAHGTHSVQERGLINGATS